MDSQRLFEPPITDDLARRTAAGRDDTVLGEATTKIREPRAESREPRAESREPRAESREPRAESREPRAESREPRAESREPRAESREPIFYFTPGCAMPRLAHTPRRQPRPPESSSPAWATRGDCLRRNRCLAKFAAATLAALLLAGAGLALAQVLTLVSNLGGSNTTTTNDILAQSFRTGSNSQGYTLSEVQLELSGGTSTAVVAVQVKEDNSGAPGTLVASLSDPVAIGVEIPLTPNLPTFTAPADTPLAANTTYWVVVNELRPDDTNKLWGYRTNVDSETGETGWTIGDGSLSKATASDTWTTQTSSLKIAVKGTAVRAPNTPATGAPAITGTATVGRTLSAGIGTIADTDGLTTKTFPDDYSFQWSREDADGTNPADITSATSTTYRLVAVDVGKKVKVKVSFQDDAGNDEELTSAAWPSGADTVANDTTAPTIVSATIDATSVVLTYDEPLDESSVPAASAFLNLGPPRTFSDVEVTGRTVTFTMTPGVSHDTGNPLIRYTRPATGAIRDLAENEAVSRSLQRLTNITIRLPMFQSAIVEVGSASLELIYDEALDESSVPAASAFTVTVAGSTRSLRSMDPVTVDDLTVTLTLASAVTAGQTVVVSYTPPTGSGAMPILSAAGGRAAALTDQSVIVNTPAAGAPTISGITQVNGIMIASTSGIMDADGLTSVSYAYQWLRVDGGSDTEITGATGSTYRLTAGEAGKKVKVKVTFRDDDGNDEERTSAVYPMTGTITDDPTGPGMPGGLVSNLGRPRSPTGPCIDPLNFAAQSFTTGSQPGVVGYSLRDIAVSIIDTPSNWNDISAFLHETSVWSGGRLMQLTNPTGGTGDKAFGLTSGATVTLKPNTTYWVRIESSNSSHCDMLVGRTDSDHESVALEGWSIGNSLWASLDGGNTGGMDATGHSLVIQVRPQLGRSRCTSRLR